MLTLDEDRPPVPPADLLLRVAHSFDPEDLAWVRPHFDLGGLTNLRLFEAALGGVSRWRMDEAALDDLRVGVPRSFGDFERMLDFGCGCGRFIRHLRVLADSVELHGTDIDGEMIRWLEVNAPYARYEVAPHEPPLPYPPHHFDLVISHSVFSHLDESDQDRWLKELQRVTRPGAILLLTVEGASTWGRTRMAGIGGGDPVEHWEAELESRGILSMHDDAQIGSTHPDFYHSTIHAPWYVFEHWSEFFDVEAYLPDGAWSQDLVVVKRRQDDAPPSRPSIGRRLASDTPTQPGSISGTLSAALARFASGKRPATRLRQADGEANFEELTREIRMIRAGLYEQGRRISILAEQLREEIRGSGGPSSEETRGSSRRPD